MFFNGLRLLKFVNSSKSHNTTDAAAVTFVLKLFGIVFFTGNKMQHPRVFTKLDIFFFLRIYLLFCWFYFINIIVTLLGQEGGGLYQAIYCA